MIMLEDRKKECKIKHHTSGCSGSFNSYYLLQACCLINLWGLTVTSTYHCQGFFLKLRALESEVLGVRGVRWNRLALLRNLSPPRVIQALVYFVKHLNNISISYPERVLIFDLMVALQILKVASNPEFPKYFLR